MVIFFFLVAVSAVEEFSYCSKQVEYDDGAGATLFCKIELESGNLRVDMHYKVVAGTKVRICVVNRNGTSYVAIGPGTQMRVGTVAFVVGHESTYKVLNLPTDTYASPFPRPFSTKKSEELTLCGR